MFVKLTVGLTTSVYLNMNLVRRMEWTRRECTYIEFTNGNYIEVYERPERIIEQLNKQNHDKKRSIT